MMDIWQNWHFYLLQVLDETFNNFEAPQLNTAIKVFSVEKIVPLMHMGYNMKYSNIQSTSMRVDILPKTTSIAQNVWLAEKAKQNM